MLIRAGYSLRFETQHPTPMLAMLSVHPSRNRDLQSPHRIITDPQVPIYDYVDAFGNICTRLTVPPGGVTLSCSFTIADSGMLDEVATGGPLTPVDQLPDDVMVYLLGSRYCETDKMLDIAWNSFGTAPSGRAMVEKIVDYTHNHIEFGYEHARPTKTAYDAWQERTGVCRDYAHLAITLCRCMNIPARYCTGYIGEFGIEPDGAPMDFSAWFEAFVDGRWYTFDARHNVRRIGRVLMARGRDATDTALTTSFGFTDLVHFLVHTDEVEGDGLDPVARD